MNENIIKRVSSCTVARWGSYGKTKISPTKSDVRKYGKTTSSVVWIFGMRNRKTKKIDKYLYSVNGNNIGIDAKNELA